MHNGKYKSFKTVLWRAMRHEFCSDLSEEQAAEYSLELIRRSQLGFVFGDITKYAVVKDYRASIPCDLVYVRGIRYTLDNVDDSIYENDEAPDFVEDRLAISRLTNWVPVKYTGNIYQSSYHCNGKEPADQDCTVTYTLNNNYIYLSEKCGYVEISYKGLLMDEEGYPLIPDNQAFEDALYYYILKEHLFALNAVGKVTDRFYNKLEQEYSWAIGQASTSLKLAGMDNWEEVMTGVRRLIQDANYSDYGYKELHNREQIKKRF